MTAHVTEYRGHIRNWRELSTRLGIDAEEFIAAAAGGDSAAGRKALEEEILVKGYEKWGTDLPDHIYGMFALTIEDEENGLIYGLRDQFGTKPYYYYVTADGRLLASLSIRKIMEQDGFVKEFNPDMLQLFLTYTYVPGSEANGTTSLIQTITQNGVTLTYTYDNNGNITSVSDGTKITGYVYDAIGQLIRVNDQTDTTAGTNGTTWVFTYDLGGNMTSRKEYAYTTGTLGTPAKTTCPPRRPASGPISIR